MDNEQLKYVLAIAKHMNLSEAAYDVSLSQSSLSKHLIKIEKELGVRLFDRSTRKMKLTFAGSEFIRHARVIVDEFDNLLRAMRQQELLEKGSLVIGVLPITARLGLYSIITSFQRKYPGVQIKMREGATLELLDLLHKTEIDAAFVGLPLDPNFAHSTRTHTLIEDELVLVVDITHPLAKKRLISLTEASNENFIFVSPRSSMWKTCYTACHSAGFSPNIIYESVHIGAIINLVSERFGVSLLTSKVVSSSSNPRIVSIPLEQKVYRNTAIAIPRCSKLSPVAKEFFKYSVNSM